MRVCTLLLAGLFASSAAARAERTVTLVAVGDMQLARGTQQMIKREGVDYPFSGTAQTIRGADLAVGNLECALSRDAKALVKRYSFKADPASADGLARAGFDVLALANNHTLDCGRAGLLETMAALDKRGLRWVGAGKDGKAAEEPLMLKRNGLRIAFLARTAILPDGVVHRMDRPGAALLDAARTAEAVKSVSKRADVVVVLLHWGLESTYQPRETQRRIARLLVDAGADLIIGHHSHTPQAVERYHGAVIAYSLGNFIFDNPRERARHGLILQCVLTPSGVSSAQTIAVTIKQCRPEPVSSLKSDRSPASR